METETDFIFLGSRITADGDCSHEIKTFVPWKKSYDQPRQHVKKQRHYFSSKYPSSQGYGFPSSHVWMWELDYKESWALKNWCFWTVVLEKILESPWDSKEIQPVIPKGNQSWILLEGLMLKLKLQYFGHLMQRTDPLEKTLMLGMTEGRGEGDNRGLDDWMASSTQWPWVWVSSRSWWWTGKPGVLLSIGSQRVRHNWATELKYKIDLKACVCVNMFWDNTIAHNFLEWNISNAFVHLYHIVTIWAKISPLIYLHSSQNSIK